MKITPEYDPFTEISKQRFADAGPKDIGNRGILFRYYYLGDVVSIAPNKMFGAGLWLSKKYNLKRRYSVHDFPADRECEDALRSVGAYARPSIGAIIGLTVEKVTQDDQLQTQITITPQALQDYTTLAIMPELSFKEELETRFGVVINLG